MGIYLPKSPVNIDEELCKLSKVLHCKNERKMNHEVCGLENSI
jgi:hypothetical protein